MWKYHTSGFDYMQPYKPNQDTIWLEHAMGYVDPSQLPVIEDVCTVSHFIDLSGHGPP